MLAISCSKIKGKDTACSILRKLMNSLLKYIDKTLSSGMILLPKNKEFGKIEEYIEIIIDEFLSQPINQSAPLTLIFLCDPFPGCYLLLTSLLLLAYSNKYIQL